MGRHLVRNSDDPSRFHSFDALQIARAKCSLLNFTTYTKPDYQVNWHHKALCKKLDDFVAGKIKRLIIETAPRHGKSELVSRRLPAYALGLNPNLRLIACSYGSTLASRMNRDVQRIIDSNEYYDVFPDTTLSTSKKSSRDALRNSDLFEIVGHTGVYASAGVGGAITGMGADIAVIDDPFKNMEEAESQVNRDKVWEWYTSTFYTRLEDNAGILITMTRWHEDDLVGRLLDSMESDPNADQWELFSLPAIQTQSPKVELPEDKRKPGEPLWPDKYPVDRLLTIKSTLGTRQFSALYQQEPSPEEGQLVQRDWWKFYSTPFGMLEGMMNPTDFGFDRVITSWDFTFKDGKGTDFVVGQCWGKKGSRKYLIDQIRDRMNFTASLAAMKGFISKHPYASEHIVEEKGNGSAIISSVQAIIPGIIAFNPTKGKEERAKAVSVTPQIEAGNVFLPDPTFAPWVSDYIEEWQVFPNGANDDQVDTSSQALMRLKDTNGLLEILSEMEAEEVRSKDKMHEFLWPGQKKPGGNGDYND